MTKIINPKVQKALDNLAHLGVVVLNDPEIYYLRVVQRNTGWTIHIVNMVVSTGVRDEDGYVYPTKRPCEVGDAYHTKRRSEVERELEEWFRLEAQLEKEKT